MKRRLQFSLRSLMLWLMLIGPALGWWIDHWRSASRAAGLENQVLELTTVVIGLLSVGTDAHPRTAMAGEEHPRDTTVAAKGDDAARKASSEIQFIYCAAEPKGAETSTTSPDGSVLTMADEMARIAKNKGHRALLQRVTALRKTHATAVVTSALTKLLSYKEPKVKASAAFIFGKLDIMPKEALPELIAALNTDWNYELTTMLHRYGPGVLPEMLAEVVLANDENSNDAGYALIGIGGKSVVPTLMKGLESKDNEIRWHVAYLLGEIGPEAKDAVPALIKIVKSRPTDASRTPTDYEVTDNDVRGWAAQALGDIGVQSETVVPLLIAALKEDHIRLREGAAWGLGKFGAKAKEAIPVLIEALKDPRFEVRTIRHLGDDIPDHWAASALVFIGVDSVPALAKALGNENVAVRRHAAHALRSLSSEAKSATDALIQAAKDQDPRVRQLAVMALNGVELDPELAVPVLVAALDDSDARVRCAAGDALRDYGREARVAVPKILEALKDKDAEVRKAMIRALSTTTDAELAVPVLARMLRDPHRDVRGVAAYVLGGFGPKARVAISALTKALDDEDDWVRDHARHALEKIDSKGKPNH